MCKVACFAALFLAVYVIRKIFKPTKRQTMTIQLKQCWKQLVTMIDKTNCNPLLLRLAWSDASTYDCDVDCWPDCGGVNGSIRFDHELNLPCHTGLSKALSMLKPIKDSCPEVSWADLIQMGAVASVFLAGGPLIEISYGRLDADEQQVVKLLVQGSHFNEKESGKMTRSESKVSFSHGIGNRLNIFNATATCNYMKNYVGRSIHLPCPYQPYPDGAPTPDVHIRNIFFRLGLTNRDAVALCGAHTLGRGFRDRSGVTTYTSGNQGATLYTRPTSIAKVCIICYSSVFSMERSSLLLIVLYHWYFVCTG